MSHLNNKILKSDINNRTAKIVGLLFLVAMVASLLGGGIIESIISSSSFLTVLPDSRLLLLIGVFLELMNGISVVGIAALMFPILKRHNESLALAYFSFRILEALFCCFIVITPLSLLKLNLDTQYIKASITLSIAQRSSINDLLIPIFFCLGAILFYYLLYKTKLIPIFISIWGFISVVLVFIMNIFMIFQVGNVNTVVFFILALPMILNEIFLGIWLIIKGFNSSKVSTLCA